MPLPDAGTLQQADTLDQQRNPGFQTENLPSPKGFEDQQVSPLPLPGTGQQAQKTPDGLSQDYISKVLGTPNARITPGNLPNYRASDVYSERYPSLLPGEDSEEAFAQGQSSWSKWGNALVKGGALAIGSFVNAITAIPDTIHAASTGKLSDAYNTDTGIGIQKWLDNLENKFPNYYSKWEQEHPALSALPFSGGFANFWGDKMVKNAGMILGAVGGAVVQDLAVGAVTEGIGEIPGVAAQVGKASLWLNKLMGADKDVTQMLSTAKLMGVSDSTISNLENLRAVAQGVKIADKGRYYANLWSSSFSFAGMEGRDGYSKTKDQLTKDFFNQNGYYPLGKDADEIEDYAKAAGNVRFGANMALLLPMHFIAFDNILKPLNLSQGAIRSTTQEALGLDAGSIGLKEGSLDELEYTSPKSFAGKAWNFVKPSIPNIASQAGYLGIGQGTINEATEDYYNRKYLSKKGLTPDFYEKDKDDWDTASDLANIFHSTLKGFETQFNSNQGIEGLLIGALTGALIGPIEKKIEKIKRGTDTNQQREAIINDMNAHSMTGTIKDMFEDTLNQMKSQKAMGSALKNGDAFTFMNEKYKAFHDFVMSGVRNGLFDVRMEQLKMLKDLPKDKFNEMLGLNLSEEDWKDGQMQVNKLIDNAKEIKKSYDMISELFPNPFSYDPKDKGVGNDVHRLFERWKEGLTYLNSIGKDVAERQNSIGKSVRGISGGLVDATGVRDFTNAKFIKTNLDNLRNEAKNIQSSIDTKTSGNVPEDRKRLDSLNKRITDMQRYLDGGKETSGGIFIPDAKDLPIFEDMLNNHINSNSDVHTATIPKAAVAQLFKYGFDMNRLDKHKEYARQAYDKLSTKEGFQKYYQEDQAKEEKREEKYQQSQGKSPEQEVPEEEETRVNVFTEDGKMKTFDKNKDYFVTLDQKKGPEKIRVVGQTDDGITIQKANGDQEIIKPEDLFKEDTFAKDTDKEFKDAVDPNTVATPPPPEGTVLSETERGPAKKDLAEALISTTNPLYDKRGTPDNEFQRRHDNFMYHLGSTDPKKMNQENKAKLWILPVTKGNQEAVGFPADWIQDTGNDADESSIRAVMVIVDKGEVYFTDGKGEKLAKLGDKVDPKEAIYSNYPSTHLEANGKPRYTNKQNLDEKAAVDLYRERRRGLLAMKTLEETKANARQFNLSRGKPNVVNKGSENPVTKVGLVRQEDLDLPVIDIATKGNMAVQGAYNESGLGIASAAQGINNPLGRPFLNHGGNLTWLNNRVFTPAMVNNLYELMKISSDRASTENKSAIFKYFNKVLFLADGIKIKPTDSSITITSNSLFLGKQKEPILWSPEGLEENKDRIKDFLGKAFHNINNSELLRIKNNPKANDLEFNELKAEEGKVAIANKWKNYNHYLLSETNPEGLKRQNIPLTTNIVVPQEGEVPIIQTYAVMKGDEYAGVVPQKQTTAKESKPITAVQEKKTASKPLEEQEKKMYQLQPTGAKVPFVYSNPVTDAAGNTIDLNVEGKMEEGKLVPVNPNSEGAVKNILMRQINADRETLDTTNTPKTDFDKFEDKQDDPQYRMYDPAFSVYKKENVDEAIAEARELLPDNFTFEKLDHVIKATGGGLAFGSFQKSAIQVWEDAKIGTVNHEVFEAVYNTFLTGEEQGDLFDEFTQRKDYDGESNSEAKEKMADEFADYMANKKEPTGSKLKRFFDRLIDFIKKLFFGDTKLNELFKKMSEGYYRDFSTNTPKADDVNYSRVPGLEAFSEAFIQDTIQGMTVETFLDVFKEDTKIVNQLEEKPDLASADIFSRLKDKLTNYFERGGLGSEFKDRIKSGMPNDIAQQLYKDIQDKWSQISANFPAFVAEQKRFMRTFNVEFVLDDEGMISTKDESLVDEEDNKNMSDYGQDNLLVNAKNSASTRIKLLYATIADSSWKDATNAGIQSALSTIRIKRENSLVALPKTAPYAKLFNYTLHNVTDLNGIYDKIDRLKDMVSDPETRKAIDANVQRVLNRLDFDKGFKDKSIDQMKVLLSWEGAFSKQKPAFFRQFVDFKGDTYFQTSVLNSKIEQLKSSWTNDIKGSASVTATADGSFIFSKDLIGIKDNLNFLNKIGIDISKKDISKLRGKQVTEFNTAVNVIKDVIEDAAKKGTKIPVISSKVLDFDSRLNRLADLYVNNISGEDTEAQHPNLDNEQTTSFPQGNHVSTVINDLNNSKTRDEFLAIPGNEFYNDIFHKDSLILNRVRFDKEGNPVKTIEVGIVEGREHWDGNNASAPQLNQAERQLYEINNNANGVFYTLLPADAKTEWAINPGNYLSAENFFGDDTSRNNEVTKFAHIMYGWLNTEAELAKDYPNRTNITELNKALGDRKKGNSLRFFLDILPKEVVDRIHSEVVDGDKSLEDIYSESELRGVVRELAGQKANDTFNALADWQLITDRGEDGVKLTGFDKGVIENYFGRKTMYDKADVIKFLGFREMNYILNNIEMHKSFFGDPAEYADELKRIKSFLSGREWMHVDKLNTDEGANFNLDQQLNKVGNVRLQPTDVGFHNFKNHFNVLTVHDIFFHSDSHPMIEGMIGDKAKPYTKGNEADGQSWMHKAAYREAMYKSAARYTADQEAYFQWDNAFERNDKEKRGTYKYPSEELKEADNKLLEKGEPKDVYFQPLKLVQSGVTTTEEGKASANLYKSSWSPLFYSWTPGRNLESIHNAMEETGTDFIAVESAHKVGTEDNAFLPLYNDKGEINTEGVKTAKPSAVPMKTMGIQVEQAKKDKGQTEGSQSRKLVSKDLMNNGVPTDFTGHQDLDSASAAWDALSEEEKLAKSPLYKKIKRHDTALKNLTIARTEATMKRLAMKADEDGTVYFETKQNISDMVLQEMQRRELPRNIADGVRVNEEGEFTNPLEASPRYDKIRTIIYSVIDDTVTSPKVNGGQKTMVSVTGFENGARDKVRDEKGRSVYKSNSALQNYTIDKQGNTQPMENLIPFPYRGMLEAAGSKKTPQEVHDKLMSTEKGRKILTLIGFRIPTQDTNSMDVSRTKSFLPEAMGDAMVNPSEVTVKGGPDFDIDKMNTYLRNTYINSEGYPELIEYQGSEEATRDYIAKLLDSGHFISKAENEEIDRILAENLDELEGPEGDFLKKIPGIMEMFSPEQITREFLKDRREAIIDTVYEKSLQNEFFDSIQDLLLSRENQGKLFTPNDASELKKLRDYIVDLKGDEGSKLGTYGRLIDSNFMMKERNAYLASKNVVGTAAVSQTSHAIAQVLKEPITVDSRFVTPRFPHNLINGNITLSGMYIAGTERLISGILSQIIDGGVDVAKDKFLAEMGIDKDTLATFIAMIRMGAAPKWAALFINQPAIQSYLKIKKILASKKVRVGDKQIIPMVAREMGIKPPKTYKYPDQYSIKQMEDAIKDKTMSNTDKVTQLMMLNDYLAYSKLGWSLFDYYRAYNWDTARTNDPNAIRLKNLYFEKADNSIMISSPTRLMRSTFIGQMRESILDLDRGFRSAINVQSGDAGDILDSLARDFMKIFGITETARITLLNKAENSMVDYSVHNNAAINGKPLEAFLYPLLIGEKNVAKYLKALQQSGDKRIANNPFVKNLDANIDTRKGYPSTIKLIERDYDTYTSNVMTDSFRELQDDIKVVSINNNSDDDKTVAQIYKNLVLAALLQNGSRKMPGTFSHLIPSETYSQFTSQALSQMHLEGYYDNDIFYRTNWMNNQLVPVIQREPIDRQDPLSQTWIPHLRGEFPQMLKDIAGIEKPPAILNLNSYGTRRVMKIVDVKRDENTNQVLSTKIGLFKRIDIINNDGNPAPLSIGKYKSLFKQINAWGSKDIQEFHQGTEKSLLPEHLKVDEVDDIMIIKALDKLGWKHNAITPDDDGEGYTDAEEVDPDSPTPSSDYSLDSPPTKELPPAKDDEPDTQIDECGTVGKFTVKK